MIDKKYGNFVKEHRTALIFAGGIATAIIGKKILESKSVKDAATKGMAAVMSAKNDAETAFKDMQDNAEEILVEANADSKKAIYEDD